MRKQYVGEREGEEPDVQRAAASDGDQGELAVQDLRGGVGGTLRDVGALL